MTLLDRIRGTLGDRPVSQRIADWTGRRLAGRAPGRRAFLVRAAVVGSALAVNPFDFVLKPRTAYASVCGADAGCGSGWTVFCCSVSGGANTCPSGSYAAGWWKVDDSAFCNAGPRYYIDCNRLPGASCGCRSCTSTGTCDRRRYCCNNFRYGQCNQQIRGVTEVVCRVVTCTPPWEWDPACTDTVLVEEVTRSHSAPCLPGRNPSPIEVKYQDMGMAGSVLGRQVSREGDASGGGRYARYDHGMILWREGLGARSVHGAIFARYDRLRRERGPLGYPVSDVRDVGDHRGRTARFERGAIYATAATGARELYGPIHARYRSLGDARHASGLGYPVTGMMAAPDGGLAARFETGMIAWREDLGALHVHGAVFDTYSDLRRVLGPLGYPVVEARPVGDGRGRVVRFERGAIHVSRDTGARAVHGPVHRHYLSSGEARGVYGYPVTDVIDAHNGGDTVEFENGRVFWRADLGTHGVHGPIAARYERERRALGPLGYPVSDVYETGGGDLRADFEGGSIVYDASSGDTRVTYR